MCEHGALEHLGHLTVVRILSSQLTYYEPLEELGCGEVQEGKGAAPICAY